MSRSDEDKINFTFASIFLSRIGITSNRTGFSGKPDSVLVGVWNFMFKNVFKIKKWNIQTSKEIIKIWVK
ncbi:hypothetical protein AYI69_g6824 [Smittium culicis]|uniref:Uncharacterized protein n=1 Tax=Smittium culicis TaxID=133412 RepID=A0A1R1XWG2_9FUNG|nr:hypothetical protein AYI69_g6824 [Smittium culicis]